MPREQEEHHARHYRGTFIPVEILDLFETGEVSARAIMLLIIVDSFTRNRKGCFASNEYLRKKLGVDSTRTVRSLISDLKDKGLLKCKMRNNNQRLLRTCLEKQVPFADTCRSEGEEENFQGGGRKFPGGRKKISRGEEENFHHNKEEYRKRNTKEGYSSAAPCGEAGESNQKKKKTRKKKEPSDFDVRAAELLRKIVNRAGGIQGESRLNMRNWEDHFRKLRELDKRPEKDIKKLLQWYKVGINDRYTPRVLTGEMFRKRFVDLWIAMNRDLSKHKQSSTMDEVRKLIQEEDRKHGK